MTSPIRVLVADDEPSVRDALESLVRSEPSLEFAGAASSADAAVALAALAQPDVALVDVRMPGNGVTAVTGIRRVSPRTKAIALTAYKERTVLMAMIRAGACCYLLKGSSVQQILDAIFAAVANEGALTGAIAADVIQELAGKLQFEESVSTARCDQLARVRRVLEGDAVTVVYQPIVDLRVGVVVGVEALLRIQAAPTRPPDVWLAEAEAVGQRKDLELAAITRALAGARNLPDEVYLAVNVSPDVLLDPAIALVLEHAATSQLVVELTEHTRVNDYDQITAVLRRFRQRGGRIAVDDAGAGFASLRHILLLAPEIIKLDTSLTHQIHADRSRRALAAALVSFASHIEADIISEGIEVIEDLSSLRALGVHYGQGFYLGQPGPLPSGGYLPIELPGPDGALTGLLKEPSAGPP